MKAEPSHLMLQISKLVLLLTFIAMLSQQTGADTNAPQFTITQNHSKIDNPSQIMRSWLERNYNFQSIRDAVEIYPDVSVCLSGDTSDGKDLNLLNFRWLDFDNDDEVRLCIAYMADILGSSDAVSAWFVAQGMSIDRFVNESGGSNRFPLLTLTGRFPDHTPKPCTFFGTFIKPALQTLSMKKWNVRSNASGVALYYMADGSLRELSVSRGSCLN